MEIQSSLPDNALIEAIIKRDDVLFERLSVLPFARNAVDLAGNTPLHVALDLCRVKYAKKLIERGADFYAHNNLGQTPLEKAMQPHLEDVFEQMVCHPSFRPNLPDRNGNPPLIGAIFKKLNVIPTLIKRGADVNLPNKQGVLPIIAAFFADFTAAQTALKEAGAVVNEDMRHTLLQVDKANKHQAGKGKSSTSTALSAQTGGQKGVSAKALDKGEHLTRADNLLEQFKAQNVGADVKNEEYIRLCVETAKRWLDENYMLPLDEECLSEAFGMKRIYFYKQFKRLANETPLSYRRRRCVEAGSRLMIEEHKNITEVARLLGYPTAARFSDDYKKVFGTHPNPKPEAALPKVRQCVEWIEAHYKEPYDTNNIAKRHNLHPTTLIVHFRRLKNMLPKTYHTLLRHQEMKRLMKEGCSLQSAVLAAGYADMNEYRKDLVPVLRLKNQKIIKELVLKQKNIER